MSDILDYDFGISALDSGYLRRRLGAIHLIVENGRAAVIDCGVNSSVPLVLEALAEKGLRAQDVEYVILTHIHLDHAGGAGALMAALPAARLTVHPRGARHMIDPSQLVAGVSAVYGAAQTRALYGTILPVDPARVVETPHGATLALNGRELVFFDTPGHARHHVAVLDTRSGHVFSGDTFGLSYRELDCDGRQFVVPTSSPVHFDPAAAHRSVDLIAGLKPPAVYVTHYSQVGGIERLADDMHRLIDAYVALARSAGAADATRHARLKAGMTAIILDEARRHGWRLTREAVIDVFAGDIELNAQGLAIWIDAVQAGRG
jgi:glyoxylase-like metal-dependent hydrolase (beta-lactamase superfamily II)